MWQKAIDGHELELWVSRDNALELFPSEGSDTVLGRAADRTRSRIDEIREYAQKEDIRRKLADVYRGHCLKWSSVICGSCHLSDLRSLKPCCIAPGDFRWVRMSGIRGYLRPILFIALGQLKVMDFAAIAIVERASDSALSVPPDCELKDIYNTELVQEDIFVVANRFAELCLQYLSSEAKNFFGRKKSWNIYHHA